MACLIYSFMYCMDGCVVCGCVHMWGCMSVHVHACTHSTGPQVDVGIFPDCPPVYVLWWGSHLNPELTDEVSLPGQLLRASLSPPSKVGPMLVCHLWRCGDLNSGPYPSTASTFTGSHILNPRVCPFPMMFQRI